jgi:hypothetical protein
MRNILQANDYRVVIDPHGLELENSVGVIMSVLRPYVAAGKLRCCEVYTGAFQVIPFHATPVELHRCRDGTFKQIVKSVNGSHWIAQNQAVEL